MRFNSHLIFNTFCFNVFAFVNSKLADLYCMENITSIKVDYFLLTVNEIIYTVKYVQVQQFEL